MQQPSQGLFGASFAASSAPPTQPQQQAQAQGGLAGSARADGWLGTSNSGQFGGNLFGGSGGGGGTGAGLLAGSWASGQTLNSAAVPAGGGLFGGGGGGGSVNSNTFSNAAPGTPLFGIIKSWRICALLLCALMIVVLVICMSGISFVNVFAFSVQAATRRTQTTTTTTEGSLPSITRPSSPQAHKHLSRRRRTPAVAGYSEVGVDQTFLVELALVYSRQHRRRLPPTITIFSDCKDRSTARNRF